MAQPSANCIDLARELEDLSVSPEPSWPKIELAARSLADGFRVKDGPEDNHTLLGRTTLPQTLTSLLRRALNRNPIPEDLYAPVVVEILRVAANLCVDHDENRGQLLEASFPQATVSLLEGYAELVTVPVTQTPMNLSINHLKVVRTAIGVLLNASVGYENVKIRLISLEAASTILKLATAIYPTGSWQHTKSDESDVESTATETWTIRSCISNWASRTISELKDVKNGSDIALPLFNQDVLPLLVPSLQAFTPPYPSIPSQSFFTRDSPLRTSLIQADFDLLGESCMLLESIALDVEDVRLSLARGFYFPAEHGGIPCLSTVLNFIEKGQYHPLWSLDTGIDDVDVRRKERLFDNCKAAMIKAVVEVAGEEKNEEVLWDDSEEGKPGGEFVCTMVHWIKTYVSDLSKAHGLLPSQDVCRDDLVICGTLSLGNLARREKHSTALLSPPHSLAPVLCSAPLLSPSVDIKIKHGVIALLKHLAQSSIQSSTISQALGAAGVVQWLTTSGVWAEDTDAMREIVQVSAIGVVKHLCNAKNIDNTFALVLSSPGSLSGLSQILSLVRRSDSIPVKSEGTRVLVNVVKSLWPNDPSALSSEIVNPADGNGFSGANVAQATQRKTQEAMRVVLTPECAFALASLMARSGKYPLLVNEGVVALSLLSTKKDGAELVLAALLAPLPVEANAVSPSSPDPTSSSAGSDIGSSAMTSPSMRSRLPRRAVDMLVSVLRNVDTGSNIPVEVRVNVCALLLQLGRSISSGEDMASLRRNTRAILEELAEGPKLEGRDAMLSVAAKRVWDSWGLAATVISP